MVSLLKKRLVYISFKEPFKDDLEFSSKSSLNSKKGGIPQIWCNNQLKLQNYF